ncbi:MAG: TonB-dependent receptor [Bacteroidota bacterium]
MKKALFVFFSAVAYAIAAQTTVSGVVKDAYDKAPLPGAAVVEKGTENGTTTDAEGRFQLTVLDDNHPLIFQFVGYEQQEIDVNNNAIVVMLETRYKLENLIVEGVRAAQDDPVSQTTVSRKEIKKRYVGQHAIFLLNELTPSMNAYSESGTNVGNYGQIRLRGIGQERVNFTLNGVPLNDMIDHGVFFSNFTDIASSFESTQVQRGVGVSATGAASYAGSINFESINVANQEKYGQLELGGGSFGTYRANFNMSTGVNEKGFGFYSSFSRLFSDGHKRHTETDAYSFFMTGGYYGERDLLRLTAFTGRSQNGLGYYTIDESILKEDPRFNNLTEDDNDDFSQYLVQLQYSRQLNDRWRSSSTLYYGGAGGDFAEGTPDEDSVFVENFFTRYQLEFFQINFPLKNDHFGIISNMSYETGDFSLTTGVHAYRFLRENRQEILPQRSNPTYLERSRKDELALFAKASYDLGKLRLLADAQLRTMSLSFEPDYDFIFGPDAVEMEDPDALNWTFFNPSVGARYLISDRLHIYSSLGLAHREPTRIDILGGFQLNGDNLDQITVGPSFEPERVLDFELGMRWDNARGRLDANFYFMDFSNEIAPIGEIIAFGVQRRRNIPESYRTGVELSWYYPIVGRLYWTGGAAYMHSNISEIDVEGLGSLSDRQHVLSPDWIINSGLQYELIRGLTAEVKAHYMSEQYMELTNNPEFTVPSWFAMDALLRYDAGSRVTVSAQLNNIFDNTYYTFGLPSDVDGSGILERGFLPAPPRNFFLTMQLRF